MASKRVLPHSFEHLLPPSLSFARSRSAANCTWRPARRQQQQQHTRLASSTTTATTRAVPFCLHTNPGCVSTLALMPQQARLRQPKRHFTTTLVRRNHNDDHESSSSSSSSTPPPSTVYSFADIQSLATQADPKRILIDVREPAELQSTGKIPGSRNLPVSSAPDAFFLPAEEFEERFGFKKPGKDHEAIFYCKAGVRSRAAARLASQAGFAGKIGEFPGSWIEWEKNGGQIERE